MLLSAVLTNGLAAFAGVLVGTARARKDRRKASWLIAGFLVAFYLVADAALRIAGLSRSADSTDLHFLVVWILGAIAGAVIARQRY
jgi:hypothetical protein